MLDHTARGWEWKTPPSYSPPTSVVAWVPKPTLKISCDKNGDIIVEPVRDILPGASYEFEYRILGIDSSKLKIDLYNKYNLNLTKMIFDSLSKYSLKKIMEAGLTHTRFSQGRGRVRLSSRWVKMPPPNIFDSDPIDYTSPRKTPDPPQLILNFRGNNVKIVEDRSFEKIKRDYFFRVVSKKGNFIRKNNQQVLYKISSEISLGNIKNRQSLSVEYNKTKFNEEIWTSDLFEQNNFSKKIMYKFADRYNLPIERNSFNSNGRWISSQPTQIVLDYANRGPDSSKLELYFGRKKKIVDLPNPNDPVLSGGSNNFSWEAKYICDEINYFDEINLTKAGKIHLVGSKQGRYYFDVVDGNLVIEELGDYLWESSVDWNIHRLQIELVSHDLKNGEHTDYPPKTWITPPEKKNQWVTNIVSVFLHEDIWQSELQDSQYDYNLEWEEEFFIKAVQDYLKTIDFDGELTLTLNLPDNWAFQHTKSYRVTKTGIKKDYNENQTLEVANFSIQKNWLLPVNLRNELLPPIRLDFGCLNVIAKKPIPVYHAGLQDHQHNIILKRSWDSSQIGKKFGRGYMASVTTTPQSDRKLLVSCLVKGGDTVDISDVLDF